MRLSIDFLTRNHVLSAALFAWFLAQLLKVILTLYVDKKIDFTRLFGAGGMPSSHSAIVTALTISIGRSCGISSTSFAISVCLALIVMYDAAGVRRAAGEQAKILNYMMEHWNETTPEVFTKELKELLGHTPLQVIAGAILGSLVGFLW